ncbi:uncharacterized protein [Temnothorax nylanderi]|uniref:uncharacterized protein n=1 Tax=Temnothorax nylanderi TaxID=102681 RepID=UPI003A84CE82
MTRNYKRTEHLSWSEESMAAAIKDVRKKMSYRDTADTHKVPINNLGNRIWKAKENFEETSPASVKDFNRTAVQSFFNLLQSVYNKYHFSPNDIYNVDETGIIIEPKSSKVLSLRREKQVGCLSSSEKILVTAETCMNAAGDYMPTMFIFPIKEVRPVLMDDSSPDSFTVYHEGGLIQKDSFIIWFRKFIEFSRPQPEKPVLLLLDGHASHTNSVELIKLAQENNVIILFFPPHWLQPLDVSFIPPLMTYYKQVVRKWQVHHPGQNIPIYKVETLYKMAFSIAAQRQTAIEGFKKSGVYPLNKNLFAYHLYAPSKTAEKPMQETQDNIPGSSLCDI